MSPLNNRSTLIDVYQGQRVPPFGMRPIMPRFSRGPLPPPGMGRVPPPPPPPPPGMFGHPRGRPIPPMPGRVGPMMLRSVPIPPPPPPMYPPRMRGRLVPPMPPIPPMPMRVPPMNMHGPMMRPGPRGVLPPHALPHMKPRFPVNFKAKSNSPKKNHKVEDLELKKPWMTDEIRFEIQKKNKLYTKAKKNKDAKEWEEFKDLRNKVTRLIRDAKNEYLIKHPDQADLYSNEPPFAYDEKEDDEDDNNDSKEESLYCEACDRDFDTEEKLNQHLQEHQTCNTDGCKFTAHAKIVQKHIEVQHATGLYERMRHVMGNGDIEKWKAERKKRYPTAANKILKEAERLEKAKRGEVIKIYNKVRMRRETVIGEQKVRRYRKRRRVKRIKNIFVMERLAKIEAYRGLSPFIGYDTKSKDSCDASSERETVTEEEIVTNDDIDTDEFEITDEEEDEVNEPIVIEKPKPKTLGLVADYETEYEDDESPDEVPIKKMKIPEDKVHEKSELPKKHVRRSLFKCESRAFAQNKRVVNNEKKNIIGNKRNFNGNPRQSNAEALEKRSKLLERLLERSIEHERNAIFQCLKYIDENNYFD